MVTLEELLSRFNASKYYNEGQKQIESSAEAASLPGLFLEFGVGSGHTTRWISLARTDVRLYAFDSFLGLPETWNHENPKGKFSTDGVPPAGLPANVEIVQGLFQDTLPGFVETHEGQAAFVHVDCDLYSSTKTVFEALKGRIVPGTIINFNEFWNYPGQENGEAKAFVEFLNETGLDAECLGWARTTYSQVFWRIK